MNDERTYERLYRETIPSVVSIYVTPDGTEGERPGAGSGFVYAADPADRAGDGSAGHVVTNQHVVGGAREVELRFSRGDWRVGEVVGTDVYTDLAVVRVADLPAYAAPLPVAAHNPRPGVRVAALGNPMGLDGTITAGIISGVNRSMQTESGFAIPDTVQTDAPINPGNSGGPLVTWDDHDDAPGGPRVEVVGVNRARAGDNIGFAVSPEIVARVVPALIESGAAHHAYLRIRTLDVSPIIAEANGLEEPVGVLVVDVSLGPASGALRECVATRQVRGREIPVGGDVILGIRRAADPGDEFHEIRTHEELTRSLITEMRPGDAVEVDLLRDGIRLVERLTLGERPRPGGDAIPVY